MTYSELHARLMALDDRLGHWGNHPAALAPLVVDHWQRLPNSGMAQYVLAHAAQHGVTLPGDVLSTLTSIAAA